MWIWRLWRLYSFIGGRIQSSLSWGEKRVEPRVTMIPFYNGGFWKWMEISFHGICDQLLAEIGWTYHIPPVWWACPQKILITSTPIPSLLVTFDHMCFIQHSTVPFHTAQSSAAVFQLWTHDILGGGMHRLWGSPSLCHHHWGSRKPSSPMGVYNGLYADFIPPKVQWVIIEPTSEHHVFTTLLFLVSNYGLSGICGEVLLWLGVRIGGNFAPGSVPLRFL